MDVETFGSLGRITLRPLYRVVYIARKWLGTEWEDDYM
jgi:hypothetical protein